MSVELKRCPICNHELMMTETALFADMDGWYRDWIVECTHCRLLRFEISTEGFYGREYEKAREEAVEKFNHYISKFV